MGDDKNKNASEIGLIESRTHFGEWCIVSSPLILGLNVNDTDKVKSVWDIISNQEAIEVNQAWAGHPGRLVWDSPSEQFMVWAKALPGGGQAALVVNTGYQPISV